MSAHKIIFSGPVGAGKTTMITSLSDFPPVSTEEMSTVDLGEKETTTVAMDYGMMYLDNGECIHLYGTPGQERFNFLWEIIAEGGIGLVLLIDNSADDPLTDLTNYVSAFKEFVESNALVVGISRLESNPQPSLNDHITALKKLNFNAPVLEIDPREKKDAVMLLQTLLFSLDPGVAQN